MALTLEPQSQNLNIDSSKDSLSGALRDIARATTQKVNQGNQKLDFNSLLTLGDQAHQEFGRQRTLVNTIV